MLIGELIKKTGLTKHTIRHYEALGLIYSDPIAAGSRLYKGYRADSIERIVNIEEGKLMGLTLKEIKPALDSYMDNDLSDAMQREILQASIEKIESQIEKLQASKTRLSNKLKILG